MKKIVRTTSNTAACPAPVASRRLLTTALAIASLAAVGGSDVAVAPPARAQAPAAAPDRAAKMRVRVYLHEIRSLGGLAEISPNNRSEVYVSAAFQGGTEMPYYTLVPPVSLGEGRPQHPVIRKYQTPYTLLNATVPPGGKVRGGFSVQEAEEDYGWDGASLRYTLDGSIQRAIREIARAGANAYLTPEELRGVALKAMPTSNTTNSDDVLKSFPVEILVDGPAIEDRVLDVREENARNPWHFQFVLRVQRIPLREDGTPILGPAAPPPAGSPDTGDAVGGDFKMIGDSGFAARVDRVRYGAPVQDDTVRVTVTYRNTSAFAQALRPGVVAAGLAPDERPEREAAGPALQWPGPANAPAGAVAPGETVAPDGLTTVVYTFKVGDAAEQERAARLRVRETRPNAPQTEFPLPAFRRPAAPRPEAGPSPEAVRGLRLLAGRYRTSLGTVVTVRADGKFLSANGVTEETAGSAAPRQAESWNLGLQADNRSLVGMWTDQTKSRDDARYQGRATLTFSADGERFTGRVIPSVYGVPPIEYHGERVKDDAPSSGNTGNTGNTGTDLDSGNAGSRWIRVGEQTPAGFKLRSLEYRASSVNIGTTTIIPKAGQKMLLVHFTLRNDWNKRTNFEFATARVAAVDAAGVVYEMQQIIGREGTGESVYTPVEPGGTMDVYAAIVMPANAEPVKLAITGDGRDTRSIDVRGKIKPLGAEYETPDLGVGQAKVGEWYEAGRIDMKLEGIQRTASYLYATISVRNRKSMRLTVDHGVINSTLTDADGAVMPWDQRLYRATSTATVPGIVLEPGGEARFRVRYPIKAADPAPKSLTLRDGRDGRPYVFAADAQP